MIKFLTRSVLDQEYEKLSYEVKDLSVDVRRGVNPVKPEQKTYDYVGILTSGWQWLLEPMKIHQPKTYNTIAKYSPSLVVGEKFWSDRLDPSRLHWSANVFLELNDWYIVVHPNSFNSSIEELKEKHPCYRRFKSLPVAVAESYYLRIDGFEVAHQLPINSMESRVLPAKISSWISADRLCKTKEKREEMRAALMSVSDPSAVGIDNLENDFRVLLDTRIQNNYEPEGDFLLIQQSSNSEKIFHVENEEFGRIRQIKDPVDLLDSYVAHVLSGASDRFAFN